MFISGIKRTYRKKGIIAFGANPFFKMGILINIAIFPNGLYSPSFYKLALASKLS